MVCLDVFDCALCKEVLSRPALSNLAVVVVSVPRLWNVVANLQHRLGQRGRGACTPRRRLHPLLRLGRLEEGLGVCIVVKEPEGPERLWIGVHAANHLVQASGQLVYAFGVVRFALFTGHVTPLLHFPLFGGTILGLSPLLNCLAFVSGSETLVCSPKRRLAPLTVPPLIKDRLTPLTVPPLLNGRLALFATSATLLRQFVLFALHVSIRTIPAPLACLAGI